MRNWWKIARLELNLAIRDREGVLWSLIAPVGMAWLFGTLFDVAPPSPTRVHVDAGSNPAYVADAFSGLLERRGFELATEASDEDITVVIPDDVVGAIIDGDEDIAVRILPGEASTLRAQSVAAASREIVYTLMFAVRPEWRHTPPDAATIAGIVSAAGPLHLETATLGRAPRIVAGKLHQIPAMLVMFIMFQLTTFFMITWVEDLRSGKIKRIVMSPTPVRDLFVAQVIARGLWALLQVIVILGVGSLALGVRLDVPWASFALIIVAYTITAISFGLLLGTFFRTTEKANGIGVITGLVLAALGGCWWPLEVVSEPMHVFAMFLPTGAAMDAIEGLLAFGPDAPFPFLNFVVLMVMTVILMPVAIHRMRRQVTTVD